MKLVGLTFAVGFASLEQEFSDFKVRYGKTYTGTQHEKKFEIFKANKAWIDAHNSAGKSYRVAVNQFADMEDAEFQHYMLGELSQETRAPQAHGCSDTYTPDDSVDYPAYVNWATTENRFNKIMVTNVKDQGSCGSCWTFSATGAVESSVCMNDDSVDCSTWEGISEQQIVSCCNKNDADIKPFGRSQGCNGGWKDEAMHYIMVTGGDESESAYPYISGTDGDSHFDTCHYDASASEATVNSCGSVESENEDYLMKAIHDLGAVGVSINASGKGFRFYSSGIYDGDDCDSGTNHAVLATGYGTAYDGDNYDQDYWFVKNSWGVTWGDNGYIKMQRNKTGGSTCCVACYPAYANASK